MPSIANERIYENKLDYIFHKVGNSTDYQTAEEFLKDVGKLWVDYITNNEDAASFDVSTIYIANHDECCVAALHPYHDNLNESTVWIADGLSVNDIKEIVDYFEATLTREYRCSMFDPQVKLKKTA